MTLDDIFDMSLFSLTIREMMIDIDEIITEIAPSGKELKDFTGGYIQQLKNSSQFVAYYGTKVGQKNKAVSKITIADSELDAYYMMLKIKIQDMKKNGATTVKIITLAERRLNRANEGKKDSPFTKKEK